jgi:hypothetical protein
MKWGRKIVTGLRQSTEKKVDRHSFHGSQLIFATNHGKAEAASEPFARILNATITPLSIDSDTLGTFTGEIERPGSMLDALRGKVLLARELTNERWVLVSEGSFSSSDGFGLIVHGIEMLMLHDALTGAEIVEQHISYDTNYATATLTSSKELEPFLKRISFGSHALVLYPDGLFLDGNVRKGITDRNEAATIVEQQLKASPKHAVLAMSDMRAHRNPTRMAAIRSCCELLAQRLNTTCPSCESGGFGLVAAVPGLPCEECGAPTQRARAERHACPFCAHTLERPRSDGATFASAAECEWCNP